MGEIERLMDSVRRCLDLAYRAWQQDPACSAHAASAAHCYEALAVRALACVVKLQEELP